ncbi:exodeoxyribonuclease VII large subunit [Candidatus Pandoraea novymonadis]|uniref:Exodeoxyribonuclease 7 large subunit n=1 Tax=Candidatus Pandoraea novymonadis TaxID=1808959 RepID=A0ABX5FDJ6_9BURK|nr:exodeoxyribonuclease VII large subunit [Candidatus Pandoraea novymonadis]PSB91823.1 Exodeoxyribonuclease 7 large subunit [Candidatus Pandoraea novymonadis]
MNFSLDDSRSTGTSDRVFTVSELNKTIADVLERNFPLSWVSGEISNVIHAASGHWYFSIKDATAQMCCVMFRSRAQYVDYSPREGEFVEVRALLSMYVSRGAVQLNVQAIRRAGRGNLYEAFLRLKEKLAGAGLFDVERKRPLPGFVRRVGVVSSLQAAALRDVLTTLSRRAPHVQVFVYPTPVQGADAALKLAMTLDKVNARKEVDVIILCRGGGSIEDLWPFNEEIVAQAIIRSVLPVVSGIGHETDFTIADFVADVRAPTPTAAAEMVSLVRDSYLHLLDRDRRCILRAIERNLEQRAQQLDNLSRRLVNPRERLSIHRSSLLHFGDCIRHTLTRRFAKWCSVFDILHLRLSRVTPDTVPYHMDLMGLLHRTKRSVSHRFDRDMKHLNDLSVRLELLNPRRTLQRGYAAVLDSKGHPVRDPNRLTRRQKVTLLLADGAADIEIAEVQVRCDDIF